MKGLSRVNMKAHCCETIQKAFCESKLLDVPRRRSTEKCTLVECVDTLLDMRLHTAQLGENIRDKHQKYEEEIPARNYFTKTSKKTPVRFKEVQLSVECHFRQIPLVPRIMSRVSNYQVNSQWCNATQQIADAHLSLTQKLIVFPIYGMNPVAKSRDFVSQRSLKWSNRIPNFHSCFVLALNFTFCIAQQFKILETNQIENLTKIHSTANLQI